jgi:hypothetical protein
MKKIITLALAAALFMGIGVQNAAAANSLSQGAFSLGIAVSAPTSNGVTALISALPVIQGKYMFANDMAFLAGLGFGSKGGDAKGTDFDVIVGARKYFKVADVAPFAGGKLIYDKRDDGNIDGSAFQLLGELGAEAFLLKQFSVEGSVGIGYISGEAKQNGNKSKSSNFGTANAGVSVNYYF